MKVLFQEWRERIEWFIFFVFCDIVMIYRYILMIWADTVKIWSDVDTVYSARFIVVICLLCLLVMWCLLMFLWEDRRIKFYIYADHFERRIGSKVLNSVQWPQVQKIEKIRWFNKEFYLNIQYDKDKSVQFAYGKKIVREVAEIVSDQRVKQMIWETTVKKRKNNR